MYRSSFASVLAMAALAAILLPSPLPAQITFQRTYGGADGDYGQSVRQTSDGGYIIAGQTYSFGAGFADAYLVKADSNGDTMWTRTYGGADYDCFYSVRQSADGGYVMAGVTGSFGIGGDVYLVRTDAAGDTMWSKTIGGSSHDCGYSVRQTADSGFVIAGYTSSFGAGDWDVYLIKTNANGDTMWTRTYGGADHDCASSAIQTGDGGYVLVGETWSYGAGAGDVWLVKTDAAGDTLWTRTYGGLSTDRGYGVQTTATDSGFIVVGSTGSFGGGDGAVYLLKTNVGGDTLWTKTFGGTYQDDGYSVELTIDAGYVVAGRTSSFGQHRWDVYLVRTDGFGDTLWTRTFGGEGYDEGFSVQQTADGGYVAVGYTPSFGAVGDDVYLIKTDPDGNVAVAEPKASPTRAPGMTLTCEPNPCRGATRISLKPQASSSKPLTLHLYDAQGCIVRSFSSLLSPPSSLAWDGCDDRGQMLPSGTYFLRLATGGRHATARLVLQR